MLGFTCSKISSKLWISTHFIQRWPCRDVSSGQQWEGSRITHKGSMNVINMKTQEMGWLPRKSWDGWVDLELNEIQIWAEPAYSQTLLCSFCWGKEEEGESCCHLFIGRTWGSATSEEVRVLYMSLMNDLESKLLNHGSWLLRTTATSALTGADLFLWEQQQDMKCFCMAMTTLWPPLGRAMLSYKGDAASTEGNITTQTGRNKKLS